MIPTRRLALVLALGSIVQVVVAVSGGGLGPVVLGASLAAVVGLATLDRVMTVDPDLIGVRRRLPGVVTLEEPARIDWHLTNPTGRSLRVGMSDQLAPSLRADARRFEVTVPARSWIAAGAGFRPSRRGRFAPADVDVKVSGPLGLIARQRRRRLPGELRVHPRFPSWKEAELRIERARLLDMGLRSARLRGGGTDFDQLREYTIDDESRRIDWAATARAGRPIVRTYRAERNQTVVNLLDSGGVMAGRVGAVPRLEHAMDAVMTLTAVSAGLGDRCGLVAFDRGLHTVVGAASGRSQVVRVTEALYEIEPALVESDYRTAFASTLARFHRRAMLVIHTDLVEQVVAETLLPALPLVARHHVVVVAAARDPEVIAWANGRANDGDEVRRRAAARASLADRERAAVRLRALGATVVDAAPNEVPLRLADTYLGVKATGRL